MNREELQKYLNITRYSLGQVEKDYFQHIVLSTLSRKAAGSLVFKGGTSLQKIGLITRFSEDLDFTARTKISIKQLSKTILDTIHIYNYQVESDQMKTDDRSLSFRLKIHGPLEIKGKGVCTIRVEISSREKVLKAPMRHEFTPVYSDILPYILEVMSVEEILAEKIRAIYTRQKARDLYDFFKLIEQKTPLELSLINAKLAYYTLSFDAKTFIKKCETLKPLWTNELRILMKTVPSYSDAIRHVKNAVKTM